LIKTSKHVNKKGKEEKNKEKNKKGKEKKKKMV